MVCWSGRQLLASAYHAVSLAAASDKRFACLIVSYSSACCFNAMIVDNYWQKLMKKFISGKFNEAAKNEIKERAKLKGISYTYRQQH